MNVFEGYARYYGLLYREKDYRSEVEFVLGVARKYCPRAQSFSELGCGTGGTLST
jgi:hypothetical protein